VQFQRTLAFTRRVVELGLLEPMQARFTLGNGTAMTLGGFQAVNRDRLKALNGEQLAALMAQDELELIYIHLQSLKHLQTTAERMRVGASEAGDQASAASESEPA
jgi:hypothetical protein